MDGRLDGRVGGWMDGWMNGWMDGWIDGWMDGWKEGRCRATGWLLEHDRLINSTIPECCLFLAHASSANLETEVCIL